MAFCLALHTSPAAAEKLSFSGSVKGAESFAKDIASDKQFVMTPSETGWTFSIVTLPQKNDLTAGFNFPIRFNGTQFFDGSYGEDGAGEDAMPRGNQRSICFLSDVSKLKKAKEYADILYWPKNEGEQKNAVQRLVNFPFGLAIVDITERKMQHVSGCIEGLCKKTISLKFNVSVDTSPVEMPKNVDCISNL